MTYDDSIKELENLVNRLNSEEIGIEESIEIYDKGILLAKNALSSLSEFKSKIEILNKDLTEMKLETEENDDDGYEE